MKHVVLGSVAFFGLIAGSAGAADLPAPAAAGIPTATACRRLFQLDRLLCGRQRRRPVGEQGLG